MNNITTHALDTSLGKPANGLRITLSHMVGNTWHELSTGITDQEGRASKWQNGGITQADSPADLPVGCYKLIFNTSDYYATMNTPCFYPQVEIQFRITDREHYHVPLLLSPFGYSTYRGS